MFLRRNVFSCIDSCVPPDSLCLRTVFREENFKSAFAIVAGLVPGALPQAVFNFGCDEPSALLRVGAVPVLVLSSFVTLFVFDLKNIPFSAHIRHRGAGSAADKLLRSGSHGR